MLTGTDINIYICRSEGYPVVSHGKSPLKPSKPYRLTISNPEAWLLSGQTKIKHKDYKYYITDTLISYEDLWQEFLKGGTHIKSFCDFENCPIPSPSQSPDFNDFVNLAGVVSSYFGIH